MVRQSDNSLLQHAIQAKAFNQASNPLNQSLNLHETRNLMIGIGSELTRQQLMGNASFSTLSNR